MNQSTVMGNTMPTTVDIDAVAAGYLAEWAVQGIEGSTDDAQVAAWMAFLIEGPN